MRASAFMIILGLTSSYYKIDGSWLVIAFGCVLGIVDAFANYRETE